jgi:hypothetical protein
MLEVIGFFSLFGVVLLSGWMVVSVLDPGSKTKAHAEAPPAPVPVPSRFSWTSDRPDVSVLRDSADGAEYLVVTTYRGTAVVRLSATGAKP